MRALVFGRTGQVARELARRHPEGIFLGRDAADLTDPDTCASVIAETTADIVLNAAAYTAVDKAEDEEPLATAINGEAPAAMARAAADKGIPFIHISTDYVFDGGGDSPWSPDHPVAPRSAYGRSKEKGEAGVAAAGGSWVILRTSWVFSAHGSNFVRTMLRLGAERDRLTIVDDQVGGPTPAAGIAETVLEIGRQLLGGNGSTGTYHYSGSPDVSWAEFAKVIFQKAGLNCMVDPIPSSAYPTKAVRPLNSRLDCASLAREFGIERPDWRAGLDDVLKELADA